MPPATITPAAVSNPAGGYYGKYAKPPAGPKAVVGVETATGCANLALTVSKTYNDCIEIGQFVLSWFL